jgi:hypothetical protein
MGRAAAAPSGTPCLEKSTGIRNFVGHGMLAISAGDRHRPVQVPVNVGSDDARHLESTLHTHDATRIIHMEAPHPFAYTLGDCFAVWGVRVAQGELGALREHGDQQLHVYVNGQSLSDPATYVLHNNGNIAIGFGTDGSFSHTPGTAMLGLVASGGLTCSATSMSGGPICATPKKPALKSAKKASEASIIRERAGFRAAGSKSGGFPDWRHGVQAQRCRREPFNEDDVGLRRPGR